MITGTSTVLEKQKTVMGFSIPIRFVYTCFLWGFPCIFDGGRRMSYDIEVMTVITD